ncbi:IS110 family transposase [bacterium]
MRYRHIHADYYAGIDVHPRRNQVCVMDKTGQIMMNRNFQNSITNFKKIIQPFQDHIAVGCESTYTYYWLADGCRESDIPFYLGHALYMKAISGNKQKHDPLDAKTIANLLRTSYFPEAYPYPKDMRPTRDLLRRRHRLVSIRAEAYSHIQMTAHQYAIDGIGSLNLKVKSNREEALSVFSQLNLDHIIHSDLDMIRSLDPVISGIEKQIRVSAIYHNPRDFAMLQTVPGIGEMLSMVILYETHDIRRFPKHQNYASYARVVKCDRTSSGKKVDRKNQKIGNPYLKWAFSTVIINGQSSEPIGKYIQRLESRHGRAKARARIAHKFCKAVYYMLKNGIPFDEKKFLQNA